MPPHCCFCRLRTAKQSAPVAPMPGRWFSVGSTIPEFLVPLQLISILLLVGQSASLPSLYFMKETAQDLNGLFMTQDTRVSADLPRRHQSAALRPSPPGNISPHTTREILRFPEFPTATTRRRTRTAMDAVRPEFVHVAAMTMRSSRVGSAMSVRPRVEPSSRGRSQFI